jgi:hypothetical protein
LKRKVPASQPVGPIQSAGLAHCAVSAAIAWSALNASAGEVPRERGPTFSPAAMSETQKPPIRIVLVSTTHIASLSGIASPHLHRSPLQWTIVPVTDGRHFGKS